MDDLVKRQDAIRAVTTRDGCGRCEKVIKNIPSAHRKAHWVENHDSDHAWKCSECGCGYTDSKLSFCYDCGADMRGENDG